ncbi:CENP-Q, a CENPA-CAD centromere complex subunit-domain-containing protein [Triangularia verruculosa]|uniref:CENP-Q, a CENPA-CAD centromere complex subunit-domain-containing protein n=1 Tax=Triangularia verruculosa TaxID=2587418 RepID=A0AAN6XRQ3_9PEZI|nr:CENP-Q, a CENPA-CAD centromere complex subunit-domain-containing protein [Triangularia verruculosa]
MAPDKPNQKRKRGRPAGASKPDENVSIRGGEAVEEISRNDNDEPQLAPKRRGRPRKSDESLPEQSATEEPPPPQQEEAPKRKGRRRKDAEMEEADGGSVTGEQSTQPADTSETAPRRRGRPGRTEEIEPGAGDENTSTAQAEALNPEPKKRGRKLRSQQTEEVVEEASVSETGASADLAPKRRGRPVRGEGEHTEAAVDEAEEPTATSKRRGRPVRIQEAEPEAEPANEEVEEPTETAPKKSGRQARTQRNEPEEVPAEQEQEETTNTAPKRRGRRGRTQEAEAEADQPSTVETEASPNTGRKKRGRATKSQDADPEEPEQPEARPRKRAKAAGNAQEQQQPDEPKQRGRPGKKRAPTQEDTEMRDAESTETDGRRSRRGRPSNEESREEATTEPEPQQKDRSAKNASRSKGRLGRVVQQEEETQEDEQVPVRRGRGRKNADSAAEPSPRSNQAEKRSKKGPRGSLTEISVSEAQNQTTNTSRKEKQSRKKEQAQPEAEPEEPQSPPNTLSKAPYRHLAPKTLNIPRSTIRSKWAPLDQPAISTIDNLILDSYIPVLESLGGNNSTRYTQSQTILRTFASRLHNKLVKGMPFPPATIGTKTTKGVTISAQEAEVNFEKVLDASSHLQRQLDPLLHSVALLKAEKEREEAMLEQDYKSLRQLEENARAQAREWRERTKREHVLAPGRKDHTMGDYDPDEEKALEVVVKKEKQVQGNIFDGIAEEGGEEELLGLAKQIGNHMESMRSNLNQIDGVVPAIQKSKAALQSVLGKYLSEEAYEGVVLG